MKKIELEKIIQLIANEILASEFENNTYLVGGYVRDLLLKNELNDLDFVVNLPQGGVKLANYLYKKRLCSRPIIYKRFGTAMVQISGHKVEFVMTRSESYQAKNRHPEVEFASLQADAFRRDFTINSLYYNISTQEIIDVTEKGFNDLKNKQIRSTSNPDLIFQEDPLRILRAIRFAGRLNFSIEKTTLQGIIKWKNHLQYISIERVKDEFIAMILRQGFDKAIKLCYQTDLMPYILPPLQEKKQETIKAIAKIDNYEPDLLIRLALIALACDNSKSMEKALIKLTINIKLVKKAIRISECVKALLNYSQIPSLNYFVYNNLEDLSYALKILEVSFPNFTFQQIIKEKISLFKRSSYPLNGIYIIKRLGLKSNIEKNYFIKEAKRIWIENPHLTKQEIIEILKGIKT